jgi:CHAD domain-containing protein
MVARTTRGRGAGRPRDAAPGTSQADDPAAGQVIRSQTGASPHDPAAVALRATLAADARRLLAQEADARRGDVEGIHLLRTAARRLRSDLRTFAPLLPPAWGEGLDGELRWLSHLLGDARDLDVLQERLRRLADDEGLGDAAGPLFESLGRRRAAAMSALREGLAGARYGALRGRLAELARGVGVATDRDAREPCRTALPRLVVRAWERLKKAGRALRPDSADEDIHEARKRAKHARYAAEAVAPALGPKARKAAGRFARRAARLQDLLGTHQDAAVARAAIARAAADRPDDPRLLDAAARLLLREHREAGRSRDRLGSAWDKLDRRKNRRWLKPRKGR